MSNLLINQYYQQLDDAIRFSGSTNETVIRTPFFNLLDAYCRGKHLRLVPELSIKTSKATVRPDGTVKDLLQQDWGYWESKDEYDDLEEEIAKKFAKGYPTSNILFEDSQTAILIRDQQEVMRVVMRDELALDRLLTAFVSYERPEVQAFRQAIAAFKEQVLPLATSLREMIDQVKDKAFLAARDGFLKLCQRSVSPQFTAENVREMIIQHILTEEIFLTIFEESQFHRENNIAKELQKVVETFFVGTVKRSTLDNMRHYYQVIKARAAEIADHHEKQSFLKIIYEEFYKAYNPKGADKLGIVYTPTAIVKFMIESTDYLLHKHFNRLLADNNVEILDPATGTGTFITELLEHLPSHRLVDKYDKEIHCNEVSILPYYIANLNIEFTYKQKMRAYREFKHICFVDTLDNTGALEYSGKQVPLGFSQENAARIVAQNERKISVIIGNPPYNANQQNENDNNKNREYQEIDKRIKETYVKQSTAQKTKLYDMYARFLRWASDRIAKDGIVAFITNNSFVNAKTFDGFRKCVEEEFNSAYIIDLGGDIRGSAQGSKGNVFGIMTGIAISFWIKQKDNQAKCQIYYVSPNIETATGKLAFLEQTKFKELPFEHVVPDQNNNWINLVENDFNSLLSLASKEVKTGKAKAAVFELFSLGIVTNRDEWVYDISQLNLAGKVNHLIEIYNREVDKHAGKTRQEIADSIDYCIKWTRAVKNDLAKGKKYRFEESLIIDSLYRPFVKRKLYFSKELNEMQYLIPQLFPIQLVHTWVSGNENIVIMFSSGKRGSFAVLSSKYVPGLDIFLPNANQCLPLYRYDKDGTRHDNITNWGLEQFRTFYQDQKINKEAIFHYTYAVLHHPTYRQKYELNLKREFPRLPFYPNFRQWRNWGKRLLELHLNYETVGAYSLSRLDTRLKNTESLKKPKLKADKVQGHLEIDSQTTLTGVPSVAWEYKLGNRSALEWVLDQYKEKKPSDPTIAEKFNTYRFADYKESVIDLLQRVCTVSVETMQIIEEMGKCKE